VNGEASRSSVSKVAGSGLRETKVHSNCHPSNRQGLGTARDKLGEPFELVADRPHWAWRVTEARHVSARDGIRSAPINPRNSDSWKTGIVAGQKVIREGAASFLHQ
jgi:hypothetical protein